MPAALSASGYFDVTQIACIIVAIPISSKVTDLDDRNDRRPSAGQFDVAA